MKGDAAPMSIIYACRSRRALAKFAVQMPDITHPAEFAEIAREYSDGKRQ